MASANASSCDWDAVSAIGTWASAVAAFVAIFVAMRGFRSVIDGNLHSVRADAATEILNSIAKLGVTVGKLCSEPGRDDISDKEIHEDPKFHSIFICYHNVKTCIRKIYFIGTPVMVKKVELIEIDLDNLWEVFRRGKFHDISNAFHIAHNRGVEFLEVCRAELVVPSSRVCSFLCIGRQVNASNGGRN